MDERNGYIALEGLDQVLKAFDKADKDVCRAAMKGLARGGMNIIADSQINLRENGSWVSGYLASSGRAIFMGHNYDQHEGRALESQCERVESRDDTTLDVGFFDTTNKGSGYALYVEYGRRAGKFPPLDELVQWARKKFTLKEKDAKSVGFLIARKIAKKGSKPHPFFQPAVKKNEQSILRAVRDAVRKKTK